MLYNRGVKMMKQTIIIILAIILSACGTFQASKTIVVESEYIRAAMRTGAPIEVVKRGDLSDFELMQLTRALNVYGKFTEKWKSPADVATYGNEALKDDYIELKNAYVTVYKFVNKKRFSYSSDDWSKMAKWHQHAERIDEAALDYMKMQQYIDAANEVMHYGRILGSMAFGVVTK